MWGQVEHEKCGKWLLSLMLCALYGSLFSIDWTHWAISIGITNRKLRDEKCFFNFLSLNVLAVVFGYALHSRNIEMVIIFKFNREERSECMNESTLRVLHTQVASVRRKKKKETENRNHLDSFVHRFLLLLLLYLFFDWRWKMWSRQLYVSRVVKLNVAIVIAIAIALMVFTI